MPRALQMAMARPIPTTLAAAFCCVASLVLLTTFLSAAHLHAGDVFTITTPAHPTAMPCRSSPLRTTARKAMVVWGIALRHSDDLLLYHALEALHDGGAMVTLLLLDGDGDTDNGNDEEEVDEVEEGLYGLAPFEVLVQSDSGSGDPLHRARANRGEKQGGLVGPNVGPPSPSPSPPQSRRGRVLQPASRLLVLGEGTEITRVQRRNDMCGVVALHTPAASADGMIVASAAAGAAVSQQQPTLPVWLMAEPPYPEAVLAGTTSSLSLYTVDLCICSLSSLRVDRGH